MDFNGLIKRFKINRELSAEEIDNHLHQSQRKEVVPSPHNSVIDMNSTCLQICDKFLFDRGIPTAYGIICSAIPIVGLCAVISVLIGEGKIPDLEDTAFVGLIFVIFSPLVYILVRYFIFRECFRYTHYPIIFNRKTRKVHVFCMNGTVMTEDWDKLYFTLGDKHNTWGTYDIRGHRLADDRKTVLETFALPYYGELNDPNFYSLWEFIRRYMEDENAPAELVPKVTNLLGVDKKRLGYGEAFMLAFEFDRQQSEGFALMMFPFRFIYTAARWLADRTSKIPRWPAEIEAECKPEPNDLYVVNEESMKKASSKE